MPVDAVPAAITAAPAADSEAANGGDSVMIAAMTPVRLVILDPLNSKTSIIGQAFNIRLAEPVLVNGRIAIPAGVTGKGEVIHAAKARAAGKAGELLIAARFLDYQNGKIPLRTLKYGGDATGRSHVDEAAVAGAVVAAPLALFIAGGQVDIPAGTPATAKIASDVAVSITK